MTDNDDETLFYRFEVVIYLAWYAGGGADLKTQMPDHTPVAAEMGPHMLDSDQESDSDLSSRPYKVANVNTIARQLGQFGVYVMEPESANVTVIYPSTAAYTYIVYHLPLDTPAAIHVESHARHQATGKSWRQLKLRSNAETRRLRVGSFADGVQAY